MAQAVKGETPEERKALYEKASTAYDTSKRRHDLSLDVYRARNVPIRHRALSIRNCAPIFGPRHERRGSDRQPGVLNIVAASPLRVR